MLPLSRSVTPCITHMGIRHHSVFVYGTLKKGEPNHNYLQVKDTGYVKYIGKARTIQKYPLVIASRYNIPFLLHSPGNGKNVIGEIYQVDDHVLSQLDLLENHPTFYVREVDQVELISQENDKSSEEKKGIDCWIYFLKQFKPYLLSEPYLTEYHSEGDHLKPYTPSHKRTPNYHVRDEVLSS